MAIYEYECRACRARALSELRGDFLRECECGGRLTRKFSVAMHRPMHEHFNASVQKPISSMRQFESELARRSEELSVKTGIEHRFAPVDPTDRKALGVTDDGLAATNRARVAAGQKPVPLNGD